MATVTVNDVRERVAKASVSGNYNPFLLLGGVLAAVGVVLLGLALSGENSERAWHLFHVNWIYFTGIAGGSIAITAVHKVVNAKWSGFVLRFAQAWLYFLPVSFVGLIIDQTLGYQAIYGHMIEQLPALPAGKAWWLSHPVMFTRLAVSLALLYGLAWKLIRNDLKPDMAEAAKFVTGDKQAKYKAAGAGWDNSVAQQEAVWIEARKWGALYVVVYALAFTMVAFDGIMALQPHWFSNLLGGWYFMGSFLGGHMCLAIMTIYGSKHLGIADLVTQKQRHDIGKLCFGFTVFWTYLMWAQFQVIWYANLPEETGFVFSRLWGHWRPIGAAVGLGMFVIPFFGLLGTWTKKFPPTMIFFAVVSLSSLWLERFLMIVPSITTAEGPQFGVPELGPTALFLGLALVCYAIFAKANPMISPRLAVITWNKEQAHH